LSLDEFAARSLTDDLGGLSDSLDFTQSSEQFNLGSEATANCFN